MTTLTFARPLPEVLADLRAALLGEGFEAESPEKLSDEDEQFARHDRADYCD